MITSHIFIPGYKVLCVAEALSGFVPSYKALLVVEAKCKNHDKLINYTVHLIAGSLFIIKILKGILLFLIHDDIFENNFRSYVYTSGWFLKIIEIEGFTLYTRSGKTLMTILLLVPHNEQLVPCL